MYNKRRFLRQYHSDDSPSAPHGSLPRNVGLMAFFVRHNRRLWSSLLTNTTETACRYFDARSSDWTARLIQRLGLDRSVDPEDSGLRWELKRFSCRLILDISRMISILYQFGVSALTLRKHNHVPQYRDRLQKFQLLVSTVESTLSAGVTLR